ncbi:MAG: HEAT repeat domain-containing protein [Polyangiaceae bacterium]|nr:HEAT repeat domain-containing protein [Polyangiaceae bacterium]
MSLDEEAELKKGRVRPAMVVLGLLLAAGGVGAVAMGLKTSDERLTVEQIAKIKKDLYVKPRAEQIPDWLKLADQGSFELKQEALTQLVLLDEHKGAVTVATKALADVDHRVRGVAAQVVAAVGLPAAEGARAATLKAFAEARAEDKPQLAWALVALNEKSVFPKILEVYKAGHLAGVQRLGGGTAFDLEAFAAMQTPAEWAGLAGDGSDSVRQLVAGILSKTGDKRYLDQLIKLVNDPKNDVAREAVSGLGKIGDPAALTPMLAALSRADKDDRQRFLEALRDGIGGRGLVLALGSVAKDPPERTKFQTKQIFDMLRTLADPRAADQLATYLETKPSVHWMTEAALRLAELGDARAVPYLADRLRGDPMKIYDAQKDPEYRRDDNERVVSARMLADLAVLHPQQAPDLLSKAEDAAMGWATEKPQPHSNALRFLVAAGSKKVLPKLRDWASPKDPLPKAGESGGFPMAYETAQGALRYLGWAKDESSWATLERQIGRKEAAMDITQAGLQGAGLTMVAMVLRGLAVGSAQGFAQWGDKRAYPILLKVAEDDKQNEGAREAACSAIGWVATDDQMKEIVAKAKAATGDGKKAVTRSCFLETLTRRPSPAATADLLAMIAKDTDAIVRHRAAIALGWGGLDDATEKALLDKAKDKDLIEDAALAILLGGKPESAARVVAMFGDVPKEVLEDLKQIYFDAFGFWSDEDLSKGRIFRWVANADGVARTRVRDTAQDWARLRLGAQFNNLEYDNGPHSMTRVVLRFRLLDLAKKGDPAAKKGAVETLKFMKEQGALMALRDEQGDTGQLAKRALFELMNPKAVLGETVPDAKNPASEGGVRILPPK